MSNVRCHAFRCHAFRCHAFRCLALLFLLLEPAAAEPEKSGGISVTDYLGRTVTLPQPARRIVALAPHIVENVYAAGAGDYLVGAVDYCDYPAAAKAIPRVGKISAYSLEAIVALKPDLVVVWMSGRGGESLRQIEKLGLTAYASDPHTLEDVARSIQDYGRLAGTDSVAGHSARTFEQTLGELRRQYAHQTPVSVLYQVWHEPLQTLNDDHIISDVIRLCGGRNSFGDAKTLAPTISVEAVIGRNPDVIIASGMGEARPEWVDNWRRWPSLAAVRNERLYFIPPDIIQRHTPRILQGAQQMCRHLHPDAPGTRD